MRIGQYEIKGISTRFWVILGITASIILFLVFFMPREEAADPTATPYFPPAELTQAKTGWLDGQTYNSANNAEEIAGNYQGYLGQTFRLKIYIPDEETGSETRPDLYFTSEKTGYRFIAGTVLNNNKNYTDQTLADTASESFGGDTDRPIQLGFRAGERPASGQAYEIVGMLWWNSKAVNPPKATDTDAQQTPSSPTIIVDRYQRLSSDELRASSTHRTNLGLIYKEGSIVLQMPTVEWSSGNEIRACLLVTNLDSIPNNQYQAAVQMTADIGSGDTPGELSENSPLAAGQPLSPGQTVPSYMIFPGTIADATKALTIRLEKSLLGNDKGTNNSEKIVINPDQIKEIKSQKNTKLASNACAPNTGNEPKTNQTQKKPSSSVKIPKKK